MKEQMIMVPMAMLAKLMDDAIAESEGSKVMDTMLEVMLKADFRTFPVSLTDLGGCVNAVEITLPLGHVVWIDCTEGYYQICLYDTKDSDWYEKALICVTRLTYAHSVAVISHLIGVLEAPSSKIPVYCSAETNVW